MIMGHSAKVMGYLLSATQLGTTATRAVLTLDTAIKSGMSKEANISRSSSSGSPVKVLVLLVERAMLDGSDTNVDFSVENIYIQSVVGWNETVERRVESTE